MDTKNKGVVRLLPILIIMIILAVGVQPSGARRILLEPIPGGSIDRVPPKDEPLLANAPVHKATPPVVRSIHRSEKFTVSPIISIRKSKSRRGSHG
ncbi:hypothetical protein LINPERPRIM_LOCUS14179 [Linum perenne]